MADYQIFTPPREPRENELVNNVIFQALNDKSTVSARIMFMDGNLAIQLFFVEPSIFVRYDFLNNKWLLNSGEPIDITTVDLTIPEDIVSAATTKTSYFDLIAFEKGTTACKLAAANDAKLLIRDSIINKGVTIPDGTTFRQYAGKIGEIVTAQIPEVDYQYEIVSTVELGQASQTIAVPDPRPRAVVFVCSNPQYTVIIPLSFGDAEVSPYSVSGSVGPNSYKIDVTSSEITVTQGNTIVTPFVIREANFINPTG